jgi:ribonuclease G
MRRGLLIACAPGELWAALVEDEALVALRVLRPSARGRVGDIFLGRVVGLRPELPAALVDIGLDRPAFLSGEDALRGGIAGLHEGQAILVQVRKAARADKAVGVSMRLVLGGRCLDLTPARPGVAADKALVAAERERLVALLGGIARPEEGFALHPAAAGASGEALAVEVDALRARWRALEIARGVGRAPLPLDEPAAPLGLLLAEFAPSAPDSIVIDDRAAYAEARSWLQRHAPALGERLTLHREAAALFEQHGVAAEIEVALQPRIALPGGGAIAIEHTAAATIIDVDSGSAGGRGKDAARAALVANLDAACAVARQIRLRSLAGPIVVDFIGMRRREHRDAVHAALAAALGDAAEVLGWTRLGHLELVIKREQAPLAELLFERLPGGGLVKTSLTVALAGLAALARAAASAPPRAPALHVHPAVAAILDGEAGPARRALEERLGRAIAVQAEPARARDTFDIRLG